MTSLTRVRRLGFLTLLAVMALILRSRVAVGQSATETPEATAQADTFVDLPTTGTLYQPLIFPVGIDSSRYRNPFDPSDIELLGIFTSPSGAQSVLPGYWTQPYVDQCKAPCTQENLQPSGEPQWLIRFTPTEPGVWKYTLQVRDDGSAVDSRDGLITIEPSNAHGFVKIGANKRYFQFDDGTPYFPIGHNLPWSWDAAGGVHAYDTWFKSLSDSGGNYARLVIDEPWFVGLDWHTPGDYTAAQVDAARLDAVLELAAKYHVELQLVLLWHQALQDYNGPPVLVPDASSRPDTSADWNANPYNAVHGGPLGSASQFFTSDSARELFHRRLRYISARWGSDPRIFAWEIIDQIDQTTAYNPAVADPWLQDAATYLRQIDAGRHLITAGSRADDPTLASSAPLDFDESQFFQRLPVETAGDQETSVIGLMRRNLANNRAPTLLTDYSLNPWYEPTASDPSGVHVQNTLWAAALSGAAGGAASAWGDTYVVPQGLERYYAPLAAFAAGVDWPNLDLQPAEAGLMMADSTGYQPVRLTDFNRRIRAPVDRAVHTLSGDGVVPALSEVPSYLYGTLYNATYHQPEQYLVTLPVDSYVEVGVRNVSEQGGARLVISVDGAEAGELAMQPSTHNVTVRVPISAGEHRLTLDNTGDDWLEMEYLEVGAQIAPARVLTLRDSKAGVALAWLQHRGYTWDQVAANVKREPVLFTYRLDQMPPGLYAVDLWDPLGGGVLGQDAVRVDADGILQVALLPMDRQMALRAFRQPMATPTAQPTTPMATSLPTVESTESMQVATTPESTFSYASLIEQLGLQTPIAVTPNLVVTPVATAASDAETSPAPGS